MQGYGKRLKDLRGDLTQTQVANAIGVAPSAIAMYESERRAPRDEIKIALAKFYHTTVEFIFFTNEGHDT